MGKKTIQKRELILIGILLICGLILGAVLLLSSKSGAQIEISVGGQVCAVYPLNENATYIIDGIYGGTNTLVVENNSAHMIDATCPDKVCIHMGTISKGGQSIICLPNQVVVQILSDDTMGIDGVVGG